MTPAREKNKFDVEKGKTEAILECGDDLWDGPSVVENAATS